MAANRLIAAAGVGLWSAVVIGFILGMLSWYHVVPPQVGWVGTGLFLVPLIGSLVASQRRTRTNPLIAAAYGIALILIGLSWNSVNMPLFRVAGTGISLVGSIVSRRRQKKPKRDDEARTN